MMQSFGAHALFFAILSFLLVKADSNDVEAKSHSPRSSLPAGALPGDQIWSMNVSTTVDNCNWWNNYGDIVVGSPNAVLEKLTFESVCTSSFWGGTDIDVFNNGQKIASVRSQFSFGYYMLIYDGRGQVLANMRESWGTMFYRTFYSIFYLYEAESDVLIGRAERSTFLNSELKWFASVKGQDCDDSDSHNNCVLLAVDEYKMKWQFLACAGYPWNFAWVNMPSNPVHRMAIQVLLSRFCCSYFIHAHRFSLQIASIEKDYILHHHKGSTCHGLYWTGLFLLAIASLLGMGFLGIHVAKMQSRSSSDGEQRPLLSS
jgi:hypothetical protein